MCEWVSVWGGVSVWVSRCLGGCNRERDMGQYNVVHLGFILITYTYLIVFQFMVWELASC